MKKVYYKFDNGDTYYVLDASGVLAALQAEMEDMKPEDVELYQWTITPVLLTDEEFENLPEAE